MNHTLLIVGIVFLIGICLAIYKFRHRMNLHNDVEQLKTTIALIFKDADKPEISQNRLIKGLKQHLEVNEKTALKLIGKARHEHFIEMVSLDFEKFGKIQFKKGF